MECVVPSSNVLNVEDKKKLYIIDTNEPPWWYRRFPQSLLPGIRLVSDSRDKDSYSFISSSNAFFTIGIVIGPSLDLTGRLFKTVWRDVEPRPPECNLHNVLPRGRGNSRSISTSTSLEELNFGKCKAVSGS
ncbi:hypothetical protein AZE42_10128 [Rhizopogon vesiculosus]|uniref:Uncharacterized protein n=1 Tax=Rhizopogon vesiculosus TaxID=180088 RepID=A0A1J8PLZ3_9AGAM|nr:hypothetical protein AZE42_10128 [Rhizopogon vesiculosus]